MRKIAEYAFQFENEEFKYRLISAFDEVKIPVDYEILKSEYLKVENQDFKIQILQAMLLFGKGEVKELIFDLDFRNSDVQELYIKALCAFYDKNENGILLDKIDCLDVYSCHDILQFLIDNENLKNDLDFYKKILSRLYQKTNALCAEMIFLTEWQKTAFWTKPSAMKRYTTATRTSQKKRKKFSEKDSK